MKFILFLLLFLFVSSGLDDDLQTCEDFTTVENCKNIKLPSVDNYCCYISKKDSHEEGQCLSLPRMISSMFKNTQTMALFREFMLFYNEGEDIIPNINKNNIKVEFNCEDINKEVDLSYFYYSEEEKNFIRTSNEHCFEYHFQSTENDLQVSNEICQKGAFTQYAINAGLKCVFVDITFISGNEKKENFKTCYPFLTEDLKNGELNELSKSYLEDISNEIFPGESDITYEMKAIGDDISASYNSKTGKLINEKKGKRSKSDMVNISKYLIILLLILF